MTEVPEDYRFEHVIRRAGCKSRSSKVRYHLADRETPTEPRCGTDLQRDRAHWQQKGLDRVTPVAELCTRCDPNEKINHSNPKGLARQIREGDVDPEEFMP